MRLAAIVGTGRESIWPTAAAGAGSGLSRSRRSIGGNSYGASLLLTMVEPAGSLHRGGAAVDDRLIRPTNLSVAFVPHNNIGLVTWHYVIDTRNGNAD